MNFSTKFLIFLNTIVVFYVLLVNDSHLTPKSVNKIRERRLSQIAEPANVLTGKRILIAVASYGNDQFIYTQDLLGSFRDLCECGSLVSIVLYSTFPFSPETLNLLNSRTNCRNPNGKIEMKVIIQGAQLLEHFVDAHRKYFYDHLNEFDLFMYTESDHNVRPMHFISYLDETQKLKSLVGEEFFADYGIGFLRYERDKESRNHVIWEQKDRTIRYLDDPKLQGIYGTVRMPHQGMYMATREQLERWRSRCQFDQIDPENVEPIWLEKFENSLNREFVSSLRLFSSELDDKGCQVRQIFPLRSLEDFMVHHLTDKYHKIPFWQPYVMSSLEIQKSRYEIMNYDDKLFVDENGSYNGIVMEKDPKSLNWDEVGDDRKKYLVEIDRWMDKYNEYVNRKGELILL